MRVVENIVFEFPLIGGEVDYFLTCFAFAWVFYGALRLDLAIFRVEDISTRFQLGGALWLSQ